MIHVQYFARYRETLGIDAEQLSGSFASLDALRQQLLARGGVCTGLLHSCSQPVHTTLWAGRAFSSKPCSFRAETAACGH